MINKYYVYYHSLSDSDNIDDIFYIGKGSSNRYLSKHHRNKYWHNKVNKNNGFYAKKIADNLIEKEAFDIECLYISIFGKRQDNGMLVNMTDGGDGIIGFKLSQEHKDKISKSLKGRQGKPLSIESKLKISLAKSGVKQNLEVIKRRSEKLIGRYKNNGYTIDMYNLNKEYIGNYKCVTEIVKKYNLQKIRGNIFGCLNNTRISAGGYLFVKNVK